MNENTQSVLRFSTMLFNEDQFDRLIFPIALPSSYYTSSGWHEGHLTHALGRLDYSELDYVRGGMGYLIQRPDEKIFPCLYIPNMAPL